VVRAYLTDEKRCYDHPHRVVKTACARCKAAYCDECLESRTDGLFARIIARDDRGPAPLFCARCVEEVEALAALEAERKRPLHQRLRPTRAGLHRAAIYLAVAAVIMVPLAYGVRSLSEATLTPEELVRIRFGLLGGLTTSEGTNLVRAIIGGNFDRASGPSRPGHDPGRLIDSWATAEIPGWRSQDATLPLDLVFALPSKTTISKVILLPQPSEPVDTWVKEFQVLVSADSPDSGFVSVVTGSLDAAAARAAVDPDGKSDPPRFEFPAATARYVVLRVLSNHGSLDYTSLGEFEVYFATR
jgi:hypothetical protein